MQTDSVENLFARAWTLLRANPVLLVPGLVVGVVAGIVTGFFAVPAPADPNDYSGAIARAGAAAFSAAITLAVSILALLVTQSYTVGMAGAAWARGTASLADGAASFKEDAGRLLGTIVLLAVGGFVIGIFTFGIGWAVLLFFAIYAIPAVVLDNRDPIPALQLSFAIATKRFASTLIIVALLFVLALVVGLCMAPLAFLPFLGPIVAAIIGQAIVVYSTLVIVGEYLATHNAPDIIEGISR